MTEDGSTEHCPCYSFVKWGYFWCSDSEFWIAVVTYHRHSDHHTTVVNKLINNLLFGEFDIRCKTEYWLDTIILPSSKELMDCKRIFSSAGCTGFNIKRFMVINLDCLRLRCMKWWCVGQKRSEWMREQGSDLISVQYGLCKMYQCHVIPWTKYTYA